MEDMMAAIQTADVLCTGDENADFLNWPPTEAQLDLLQAKFNQWYPEVLAIRGPRKLRCTPRQ